jgi:Leucine rich repeat
MLVWLKLGMNAFISLCVQGHSSNDLRHRGSSASLDSTGSNKDVRKRRDKDRAAERNRKHDSLMSDVDIGHIVEIGAEGDDSAELDRDVMDVEESRMYPGATDSNHFYPPTTGKFKELQQRNTSSLDRSSSDQSTGSLLYCKTPTTGRGPTSVHGTSVGVVTGSIEGTTVSAAAIYSASGSEATANASIGSASGNAGAGMILGNSALGKSSSLIFPTGVDSALVDDRGRSDETSKSVRGKVNFRLDQCEAIRFPFKKKLMLDNMHLTNSDIPMKDLCGTPLGNALFKLSLAKNRLGSIPPKLVMSLPSLRSLDLSQCELHQLPEQFNLPKLQRLNLRHNRFTDFPDEVSLRDALAV